MTGFAPTIDGGGYWLVQSDGTIDAFGDATNYGSLAPPFGTTVVALLAYPDGGGYAEVLSDPNDAPQGLPANNVYTSVIQTPSCQVSGVGINPVVVGAANDPGAIGYAELIWWPKSGTGGDEEMAYCTFRGNDFGATNISADTEYLGAAGSVALNYNALGAYAGGDLGYVRDINLAVDGQPNPVDYSTEGAVVGTGMRP